MSDPLLLEIRTCIEKAKEYGLSSSNPIVYIRRQNVFCVYIVTWGVQPNATDVGSVPKNVVYIDGNPDSANFERAFMQNEYVAGWWLPVGTTSQFFNPQLNYYALYSPTPLSKYGDKAEGQIHARTLGTNDYWRESEFVPLSYIRTLIKSGGSGGDENLESRVGLLEQELTRLDKEIKEIDTTTRHNQLARTSTWIITHGFGARPSVIQVYNEFDNPVIPKRIIHNPDDPNVLVILFSSAEKGSVSLIK